MDDRIPVLLFGLCLVIGGLAGLLWHVKTWRDRRDDAGVDERERRYYRRQFLRRIQATGLIALLGVLLPVGLILIPWKDSPGWFGLYWFAVLVLAFWVMLLGLGDLLSTRVHSRSALQRLREIREEQRSLEEEVARLKRTSGGPHHLN